MHTDRWLGVELRHLAALQAVARKGSFGRAALELGYAQSAISAQIAALERAVGRQLFDRPGGSRRVRLTEAGELLLEHAEALLARLSAARADLASVANGRPTIRVGTYQSAGMTILPPLVKRFKETHPGVELSLTESPNHRALLRELEDGGLDVAFTFLPLPETPFEGMAMVEDPYVVLAPAEWPLGPPLALEQLSGLPCVMFEDCSNQRRVEQALAAQGVELEVVLRVADTATAHALVAAGVGFALIPRLAVQPRPDVAVLELDAALPPRVTALAWHGERRRPAALDAFVGVAREVAGTLSRDQSGTSRRASQWRGRTTEKSRRSSVPTFVSPNRSQVTTTEASTSPRSSDA